jgi:N-acetylmuramoyl-L-alanine amidase
LHANSALSNTPKGAEIFYYDGATSLSASADFARTLNTHYKLPSGGRVMRQDFGVLRCQQSQTPAVLLELGYLSNPDDRAFLRAALHDDAKAGRIADMIADGVSAYLEKKRSEQNPGASVTVAALGFSQ